MHSNFTTSVDSNIYEADKLVEDEVAIGSYEQVSRAEKVFVIK